MGRERKREREREMGIVWAFKTTEYVPSDTTLPNRSDFLTLLKEFYQMKTKHLNT